MRRALKSSSFEENLERERPSGDLNVLRYTSAAVVRPDAWQHSSGRLWSRWRSRLLGQGWCDGGREQPKAASGIATGYTPDGACGDVWLLPLYVRHTGCTSRTTKGCVRARALATQRRHTDHAGVLEPIAHPSMARNGSGRAHGVAEAATSWHVSHGAHQRTACGEQLQLYLNGTW